MSRNIALLSDGTGNSAAKVWRTNVWRTFEALDLSGNDQVAFYDDGVGASTFKPWAILGGAFGFGLSDDIYGFGFSRGVFTIRVVIVDTARQRDRSPKATDRPLLLCFLPSTFSEYE